MPPTTPPLTPAADLDFDMDELQALCDAVKRPWYGTLQIADGVTDEAAALFIEAFSPDLVSELLGFARIAASRRAPEPTENSEFDKMAGAFYCEHGRLPNPVEIFVVASRRAPSLPDVAMPEQPGELWSYEVQQDKPYDHVWHPFIERKPPHKSLTVRNVVRYAAQPAEGSAQVAIPLGISNYLDTEGNQRNSYRSPSGLGEPREAEFYRYLRDHGDTEGQPCVMLGGRWYGGSNGVGFNLDKAMAQHVAAPERSDTSADVSQQLRAMRSAFHQNMLRAFPEKTHEEIAAEIDRACGAASKALDAAAPAGMIFAAVEVIHPDSRRARIMSKAKWHLAEHWQQGGYEVNKLYKLPRIDGDKQGAQGDAS